MDKKSETKAGIILLGIITISIFIFVGITYSFEKLGKILLIYGLLLFIVLILYSNFRNKTIEKLASVVAFPFRILSLFFSISMPVIALLFHVFLYFMLPIIVPQLFMIINEHFKFIELSSENNLYITLTLASLISIIFYKWILKIVYILSPSRVNTSLKIKIYKLKDLTEYILTPQNIRFIIYSLYFVYLCVFSINLLGRKSFLDTPLKDTAVMQAFLTFLAFDSLRINSKEVRVLPTILLQKLLLGFFAEAEIEKENQEQNSEKK
jgi:hypothetical protein